MIGMISDFPAIFHATPELERRALTNYILPMINEYLTETPILGTTLFASPWSYAMSPELKDIIQSLQQLILHHEQSLSLENHSSLIENDFLIMLARQLLAVPSKAHLNPFQETIRVSVFIYFMTRIWSFGKKPCTVNLVRRLRGSLDECLDHLQSSPPDLLFWIFFMRVLQVMEVRNSCGLRTG